MGGPVLGGVQPSPGPGPEVLVPSAGSERTTWLWELGDVSYPTNFSGLTYISEAFLASACFCFGLVLRVKTFCRCLQMA